MAPVNEIQLYYAVFGAGDPVILLHGGLASSIYWNCLVPDLTAHGFQVIVADSRGHGRSTRSSQAHSYSLMASDVLGLLDYLNLSKVDLVGWSDGGIIGLDLAIHHPERLKSLFTYGAHSDLTGVKSDFATNPVFAAYIERTAAEYRELSATPDHYGAFQEQISRMWMTQPDFSASQLHSIKLRSAVAAGEYDEGIKVEHTEYLARMIPGAELCMLPDLSHFGMLQNSTQFNAAVIQFLTGKQDR